MESNQKSLINNSAFNFIKTFSSLVFPIITFTYSARILGEEGIGKVSFSKAIVSYFVMFALLGMNYYGTREVAKLRYDKEKLSKFVHEMLIINGFTTLLAYVALYCSAVFIPKLYEYKELLVINSFAIILQVTGMDWLYQGLEEYRSITIRTVFFQFISLVAMLFFVRRKDDILAYAIICLLASYGAYAVNFITSRKYVFFHRCGVYEIKKHMKPLLWLFALVVSMELFTVLDSTMLGFLQGDAAVGRYTAAVKVNKMVNTLITSIGVVLIPRLAFYIDKKQNEKVYDLVEKAYNYVFLISIPAAVGLFTLSNDIILLFSGSGFVSAGITMRLLTPIVLVIPFSITTNQQTLIPMGKEKLMLIATSLGAVTNMICNFFLIPRFSENGAAIATVIAETIVALVSFINASRFFDMRTIFSKYYQYWIAAIPIPLIAMIIRQFEIHYVIKDFIIVLLSIWCYLFILFQMKNQYIREFMKVINQKTGKKVGK